MTLVGKLYKRMCELVVVLDYKIDVASRTCSNLCRFGSMLIKCVWQREGDRQTDRERKRELMWTRGERERASMDGSVDVIQKLSSVTLQFYNLLVLPEIQTGFSNGKTHSLVVCFCFCCFLILFYHWDCPLWRNVTSQNAAPGVSPDTWW